MAASLGAVLAAGLFGLLLVSLGDHLVDVVFEVIVIGGIVAGQAALGCWVCGLT